jgi:hypothetical protein
LEDDFPARQDFRCRGETGLKNMILFSLVQFLFVIPNETTQKTMEDTDAGRNLILCKDADDIFKKLGI